MALDPGWSDADLLPHQGPLHLPEVPPVLQGRTMEQAGQDVPAMQETLWP